MKTQAIPKFVTQLDGREVVIPAVLFHFDNPHAVAERFKALPVEYGICSRLCAAYEETTRDYEHSIKDYMHYVKKTYTQVSKALALWDFTDGTLSIDWYLEDYFYYRYGIDARSAEWRDYVMQNIRWAWQQHIAKHLLAAED